MDTTAVMSPFVVTVGPETALADVEMLLLETGFATIPVVDADRHVVGVVRPVDLPPTAGLIPRPRHQAGTAADVMRRSVTTAGPDTTLGDLVRLLWHTGLSSVPVVDGDELVGIVARRDIATALGALPVDARRAALAAPAAALAS
ncbi:HPP family protein [Actinomycetospora cinnamomea]|uniref:CBS domain protein n=1 Tax=Actinomycetospora cinnamomea TaxID=663609 RepID=A0A2U1F3S7_9PSEU|nr:CBS domain-containing protein [Actinomycetospora cinnamomea]PVZ06835.1 CBS domain protein [Actinomycetospora cinnamomea]